MPTAAFSNVGRVAADQEDRARQVDIVVAVRHRAIAPGIGHARDRRRMADARLMIDVVRPPERCKLGQRRGARRDALASLRRAHLGAQRQLPLGQTVAAVLPKLGFGTVLFRAASAERALVHLAARTETAGLRKLWRSERTSIRAIAAADAQVLRMEDHAICGLIDAVDRAYGDARRIRAVHAADGNRPFARPAVIQGDHPPPVDPPGDLMLVLARRHARIAFDAALGIAQKLHPCHGSAPHACSMRHRVTLVSCICVTESYP